MLQYLFDRFGNNLNKYDIQNLKNHIIRPIVGNKTKLPISKKDVLELSYSIDAMKTLEYLTKKSDNDLKEILGRYRNMILDIGMNTQNPVQAVEMLEKFEETEKKYQSLIKDEDFHDVLPFPPKRITELRERVKSLTKTPAAIQGR